MEVKGKGEDIKECMIVLKPFSPLAVNYYNLMSVINTCESATKYISCSINIKFSAIKVYSKLTCLNSRFRGGERDVSAFREFYGNFLIAFTLSLDQ